MTVTTFPNRGDANPDTRTGGREDLMLDLQAQITALSVGSATADTFFSAASNSSAVDVTLTQLTTLRQQTMTTSGKSIILPDCTSAASCFEGAWMRITNPTSATYSFDVKDNGGAVLVNDLAPGETAELELLDDSTAAGTWVVRKIWDVNYGTLGAALEVVDEPVYLRIPYNCEIVEASSHGDASGSWVVDVWKDAAANYPPTNADSITSAAPVTASGVYRTSDTTLTGWTKTLAAGDFLAFNLDSLSGASQVVVQLRVKRI